MSAESSASSVSRTVIGVDPAGALGRAEPVKSFETLGRRI
jgi:hypothetical protein